jgi:hypothetical protein
VTDRLRNLEQDNPGMLDEDTFNLEVRKLLKTFGVGAQREIEKAVDDALESGRLSADETLSASIRLEIPELDLSFTTDGDIRLS